MTESGWVWSQRGLLGLLHILVLLLLEEHRGHLGLQNPGEQKVVLRDGTDAMAPFQSSLESARPSWAYPPHSIR